MSFGVSHAFLHIDLCPIKLLFIVCHAHEMIDPLVLGSLLVNIGLAVVSLLIELVGDGIASSLGAGAEVGIAVLGDVLVGLLGSSGTGARNGLGNVVCGVPGTSQLWYVVKEESDGSILDGIHCEGLCMF